MDHGKDHLQDGPPPDGMPRFDRSSKGRLLMQRSTEQAQLPIRCTRISRVPVVHPPQPLPPADRSGRQVWRFPYAVHQAASVQRAVTARGQCSEARAAHASVGVSSAEHTNGPDTSGPRMYRTGPYPLSRGGRSVHGICSAFTFPLIKEAAPCACCSVWCCRC